MPRPCFKDTSIVLSAELLVKVGTYVLSRLHMVGGERTYHTYVLSRLYSMGEKRTPYVLVFLPYGGLTNAPSPLAHCFCFGCCSYWNTFDFTGGELPFADGGAIDNTAVTPLLRRKVAKIIACVAAAKPSTNTTAEEWTSYEYDIAGLFGAVNSSYFQNNEVNGVPVEQFNRMLKVGWEGRLEGVVGQRVGQGEQGEEKGEDRMSGGWKQRVKKRKQGGEEAKNSEK